MTIRENRERHDGLPFEYGSVERLLRKSTCIGDLLQVPTVQRRRKGTERRQTDNSENYESSNHERNCGQLSRSFGLANSGRHGTGRQTAILKCVEAVCGPQAVED